MLKIYFCLIPVFCHYLCRGQVYPLSPSRMSLAGSGLAGQHKTALFDNPSAMPDRDKPLYGISFQQAYMVRQLSVSSLFVAMPVKQGTIGGSLHVQAFDTYQQLRARSSFARKFGEWSAALQVEIKRLVIRGYGSVWGTSFNFSLSTKISSRLQWSALAVNPLALRIKRSYRQTWPVELTSGFAYSLTGKTELYLDIYLGAARDWQVRAGASHGSDKARLMLGWSSGNECLAMGCDLRWRKLNFLLAATYHSYLGVSPQNLCYYEQD